MNVEQIKKIISECMQELKEGYADSQMGISTHMDMNQEPDLDNHIKKQNLLPKGLYNLAIT